MGFQVEIPEQPKRIISLVPSQTELLFDLGLEDRVAGITKFCIHPAEQIKNKPKIGGTKNFNFEEIAALKPDMIIGNKEENYQVGILQLKENYTVWMSDISNLVEATEMIRQIGVITNTFKPAQKIIHQILTGFQDLNYPDKIPAAYFIWREPFMSVGQDTFIHQMLDLSGFANVFADYNRYPEITPEQLQAAQPAVILLSSEPYPFKEKHLPELKNLCPNALIKLVDGEMFSWYGSRLQYAGAYFQELRKAITSAL
ncbi:ABC transporter substrate-binding protein [Adhaeribacter swui]|uniref:ABC transporter substrate-binding protein n=2 Tax=Adhaeribacter swui TaxID=2086471 RepID=A0A7G7GFC4_9BACT|nr:ABC transporter substrate-binding protein [Adhaeribacter swui]